MSSLRNAVKRRTHKERSQPAERRKFGLLEKKKDYILRARDFHKKEEALKVLRKKAANRNPDEFYFAMQKQRTNDGVHIANEDLSNKYTQDELHLMKTQDVKYVAMKASMEAKKVEKLRATLHMIGDGLGEDDAMDDDDDEFDARRAFGSGGKKQERVHIVFADESDSEDEDARLRRAKPKARAGPSTKPAGGDDRWGDAEDDDDEGGDEGGDAELAEAAAANRRLLAAKVSAKGLGLRRGLARSLEADENEGQESEEIDPKVMKKIEKKRRVAYQELKEREHRAARLKRMALEMAYQKEVSHARGHKRKLKPGKNEEEVLPGLAHLQKAPPVFKWKKERKK